MKATKTKVFDSRVSEHKPVLEDANGCDIDVDEHRAIHLMPEREAREETSPLVKKVVAKTVHKRLASKITARMLAQKPLHYTPQLLLMPEPYLIKVQSSPFITTPSLIRPPQFNLIKPSDGLIIPPKPSLLQSAHPGVVKPFPTLPVMGRVVDRTAIVGYAAYRYVQIFNAEASNSYWDTLTSKTEGLLNGALDLGHNPSSIVIPAAPAIVYHSVYKRPHIIEPSFASYSGKYAQAMTRLFTHPAAKVAGTAVYCSVNGLATADFASSVGLTSETFPTLSPAAVGLVGYGMYNPKLFALYGTGTLLKAGGQFFHACAAACDSYYSHTSEPILVGDPVTGLSPYEYALLARGLGYVCEWAGTGIVGSVNIAKEGIDMAIDYALQGMSYMGRFIEESGVWLHSSEVADPYSWATDNTAFMTNAVDRSGFNALVQPQSEGTGSVVEQLHRTLGVADAFRDSSIGEAPSMPIFERPRPQSTIETIMHAFAFDNTESAAHPSLPHEPNRANLNFEQLFSDTTARERGASTSTFDFFNHQQHMVPSLFANPAPFSSLQYHIYNQVESNSFGLLNSPFSSPFDTASDSLPFSLFELKPTGFMFSERPSYSLLSLFAKEQALDEAIKEASSRGGGAIAVYTAMCRRLGYPTDFSYLEFTNLVRSTNLTSSYNLSHKSLGELITIAKLCKEVGGVAMKVGLIEGLKNHPEDVICQQAVIALNLSNAREIFSSGELRQVIRELTQAIYVHQTYPFFSLHFNNDKQLYPVLHPAYRKTLVGETIGFLDYFMKGFLNGGVYPPEFLRTWYKTQNSDRAYLKSHLLDIKTMAKQLNLPYLSVREMMYHQGLEHYTGEVPDSQVRSDYGTKFRNSFRIIASHGEIKQRGHVFAVKGDFDVKYSIEVMPDHQETLRQQEKLNGEVAEEHRKLEAVYRQMAQLITDVMPQLPLFKPYFQKLEVITFLCYYLTTLKEMGRQLELVKAPRVHKEMFPPVLPSLPVRYYQFYPLELTLSSLIGLLGDKGSAERDAFDAYCLALANHQRPAFPENILGLISGHLGAQLPAHVMIESEYLFATGRQLQNVLAHIIQMHAVQFEEMLIEQVDKQPIFSTPPFEGATDDIRLLSDKVARWKEILKSKKEQAVKALEDRVVAHQSEEIASAKAVCSLSHERNEAMATQNRQALLKQQQAIIDQLTKAMTGVDDEVLNKVVEVNGFTHDQVFNNRDHYLQLPPVIAIKQAITDDLNERIRAVNSEVEQKLKALSDELTNTHAANEQRLNEEIERITRKAEEYKHLTLRAMVAGETEIMGWIDKFFMALTHFSDSLLECIEKPNINLLRRPYQHSHLDIADRGYYEDVGDNFNIVGGTGFDLSNVKPLSLALSESHALVEAMNDTPAETFKTMAYDGQHFASFTLPIKFEPLISAVQKSALLDLFDEDEQDTLSMDEVHEQSLVELSALKSEERIKEVLERYPLHALTRNGQTIAHFLASNDLPEAITVAHALSPALLTKADEHGQTPLHVAAQLNHINAMTALMTCAPTLLEAKNNVGMTALMTAAQYGQTKAVSALLRHGSSAMPKLASGLNALFLSLYAGYPDTALTLIEEAADLDINLLDDSHTSALHLAIELEYNEVALALIAQNAHGHIKRKTDGLTPLHCAATLGEATVLNAMLSQGADALITLDSGKTAMHMACAGGHLEAIALLSEKATTLITQPNKYGETPLMTALSLAEEDAALYLLQQYQRHSLDINAQDESGQTALHYAIQHNLSRCVEFLFELDADMLIKDKQERDPAYYLLVTGDYEKYTALYANKRLNRKAQYDGESSLALALQYGHRLLADFLEEKGVAYHSQKYPYLKPIHFAVMQDDIAYLKNWFKEKKKLQAGTIAKGQDKGKNLVYLALEANSINCLQFLLMHASKEALLHAFGDKPLLFGLASVTDSEVIELVMRHSEQPNAVLDNKGNTIAHLAVKSGNKVLVERLTSYGVSLLVKNKDGLTPHHLAIEYDDKSLLKKLITRTEKQALPPVLLAYATQKQAHDCQRYLLQYHSSAAATITQDSFLTDCQNGNGYAVEQFIAAGKADKSSGLPLSNALRGGHTLIAECLIKHGFKLNELDTAHTNAFTLAAQLENVEIMAFLMAQGLASFEERDAPIYLDKETCLSLKSRTSNVYVKAALTGDFSAYQADKARLLQALDDMDIFSIRQVINLGFPIDTALFTHQGVRTPYLHCVMSHHFEAAVNFLKDKVNPFRKDENGSPLIAAMVHLLAQEECRPLAWLRKYFPRNYDALLKQKDEGAVGSSILKKAMNLGNVVLVNDLLKAGYPIEPTVEGEESTFHLAAFFGVLPVVQEGLRAQVDINERDKNGLTALMYAAQGGREGVVRYLVTHGANLQSQDRYGNTALHHALIAKQQEVALFLLESALAIDVANRKGQTPLHVAANRGLTAVLGVLLKRSDLDFTRLDKRGLSVLAHAVTSPETLERLLTAKKASATTLVQQALVRAAALGQVDALQLLVQQGGDLLALADDKAAIEVPVIALAIGAGNEQMVRFLRQTPTFFVKAAQTPMLIQAAMNNRLYAIRELLLNGADINGQNKKGVSPLAGACLGDAVAACALLLKEGANVMTTDVNGYTPLHVAALKGALGCTRLLLESGAKVDALTIGGETPLCLATAQDQQAVKRLLTQHRATIDNTQTYNTEPTALSLKKTMLALSPLLDATAKHKALLAPLMATLSSRSRELCLLGLHFIDSKEQGVYLDNWVGYLSTLPKERLEQLEHCLLAEYPWHVFASSSFFTWVDKINADALPLQNLFWKYLAPKKIIALSQHAFEEKIQAFVHFTALFEGAFKEHATIPYALLDELTEEVSFSLDDGAYLTRMNYALMHAHDKERQARHLEGLPEIAKMESLFAKGALCICPLVLNPPGSYYEAALQACFYQRRSDFASPHFHLALVQHAKEGAHPLSPSEYAYLGFAFREALVVGDASEVASSVKSIVGYAHQIKQQLGMSVFRALFAKTFNNTSTSAPLHEEFIKVARALLALEDEVDLVALLQKKLPCLTRLYLALEKAQQEVFLRKYPEKPLEDVVAAFKTRAGFVQERLSEAEVDAYQAVFPVLEETQKAFINASELAIQAEITSQALKVKQIPNDATARAQLLGLLAVVMQQFSGKKPYRTQLFALLALTHVDEGLKGRLGQILTGEGKSLILALLTAFYAVQGEFVDVITSSANLARRDQQEYGGFFERLGITTSHISPEEKRPLTRDDFNGQVLYGTNTDFEFALLREMLYGEDVRYTQMEGALCKRFCERVIVDEADNLFLDTARNAARLAIPSPRDISFIYSPIFNAVKGMPDLTPEALKETVLRRCDEHQRTIVKTFTMDQFRRWKASAQAALNRVEDKDYVVKGDDVIIVDYSNTGRLSLGSRWSGGIHEFIEVKHGLKPEAESLTAASMSHPAFFLEYKAIVGVTGTMGTLQEREEIKAIYHVSTFDVPPHRPCQRSQRPTRFIESREEHFEVLVKESDSAQRQGQAVLILFETIKDSLSFSRFLNNKGHAHYVLNANQKEDEEYLIALAGQPGKLTIATNTAGRGIDIRLHKDTLAAGGLHMLFAFYPQNTRVLAQGYGRAGRQGQPGSCQLVLWDRCPSVQRYLPEMMKGELVGILSSQEKECLIETSRREITRAISSQRLKTTPLITAQYQLLKAFCLERQRCNEAILHIKQSDFEKALKEASGYGKRETFLTDNMLAQRPLTLLKQTLLRGSKADKEFILPILKDFYYQYIGQLWGEFFTELDRQMDATVDVDAYQTHLQQQFGAFMRGRISRYMTGDANGFYTLLGEMIEEVKPKQSRTLQRFGLLGAESRAQASSIREDEAASKEAYPPKH